MARSRDSIANTLTVAIGVSLVCSILVSSAAVVLRPIQDRNEVLFRQTIVLQVAGLYEPGIDVADRFATIEAHMVDLETGEFVDDADASAYDAQAAANDPDRSVAIPASEDIAGIKRRAQLVPVYLIRDGDRLEQIILPVYGK
ncbi:MAG: Na(+)-translocating NADH-quinone reductase subunit C, partial [Woeseiaceae bacterium]|nr:Na(+)-translocating NADH-quinone reductase subunit C [Woeseiaceae bacterium]